MAMNLSSKSYIDNVLEVVALKSSILLTENDVKHLGNRHNCFERLIDCINSPDYWLRIDYTEMDNEIVALRKCIGNLPDDRDAYTYMAQEYKKKFFKKYDMDILGRIQELIKQLIEERKINDKKRIMQLSAEMNVPALGVIDNILILGEMQNRSSIDNSYHCNRNKWDGVITLADLFEKEITPQKKSIHFDQEFINYLKENAEDIHAIHWRNFERLIAEFFNKIGYEVVLGPGTNDGGIDIRIYNKENKEIGPPLIIVQCKRYKKENTVDINTVKAFYTDILFEGAKSGLIATTSRIASGGHKIIEAREYPISVAESYEVQRMVNEMWRYHYKL